MPLDNGQLAVEGHKVHQDDASRVSGMRKQLMK